jgi:hypothetical protein
MPPQGLFTHPMVHYPIHFVSNFAIVLERVAQFLKS